MLRNLEGRRIAIVGEGPEASAVRSAMARAGALVNALGSGQPATDWHGGKYAALVIAASEPGSPDRGRLTQLAREFLASDKPLAATGSGVRIVLEADGVSGRTIAATGDACQPLTEAGAKCADGPVHADGALITAVDGVDIGVFAQRVVAEFTRLLEEHTLDEPSELSFPASDPPASSPSTVGHISPERDGPSD